MKFLVRFNYYSYLCRDFRKMQLLQKYEMKRQWKYHVKDTSKD